jgi:aminopeptidase-like protein
MPATVSKDRVAELIPISRVVEGDGVRRDAATIAMIAGAVSECQT